MKSYRILKKIPPKSIKTPQNSYTHIYFPTLGSRQIQEPVLDPLSRCKLVCLNTKRTRSRQNM